MENEMMVNEVVDNEVIESEVEETNSGNLGLLVAGAIGAGITAGVIFGGKKLKSMWKNHKNKKAKSKDNDECSEEDDYIDGDYVEVEDEE